MNKQQASAHIKHDQQFNIQNGNHHPEHYAAGQSPTWKLSQRHQGNALCLSTAATPKDQNDPAFDHNRPGCTPRTIAQQMMLNSKMIIYLQLSINLIVETIHVYFIFIDRSKEEFDVKDGSTFKTTGQPKQIYDPISRNRDCIIQVC